MTIQSQVVRTTLIDAVTKELHAKDPSTRIAARQALVRIGTRDVVTALIEELKTTEFQARWEAAKALGEIGDPQSAMPLLNLLNDEEPDVRWVAADGLAGLGEAGLEALLRGLTRYGYSIGFCHSAHHALHELAKQGFHDAVKPVMTALEELEPTLSAPNAAYDQLLKLGYL